jgi:hypothetical protein
VFLYTHLETSVLYNFNNVHMKIVSGFAHMIANSIAKVSESKH